MDAISDDTFDNCSTKASVSGEKFCPKVVFINGKKILLCEKQKKLHTKNLIHTAWTQHVCVGIFGIWNAKIKSKPKWNKEEKKKGKKWYKPPIEQANNDKVQV